MHQDTIRTAVSEHDVQRFVVDTTIATNPGADLVRYTGVNSIPLVIAIGPGTNGLDAPAIAHETFTDAVIVELIERAAGSP